MGGGCGALGIGTAREGRNTLTMAANTPKALYLSDLEQQLARLLSAFAEGRDVSPADFYGVEGMMACAQRIGLAGAEDIRALLLAQVALHLDEQALELYRADSEPRLHMQMRRAPVYPSTRDE